MDRMPEQNFNINTDNQNQNASACQNSQPMPQPIQSIQGISQSMQYGESEEQKQKRTEIFGMLMMPTLVYAVLYTFFLYDNFSSITMPLFVLTTVGYVIYCLKNQRITIRKDSIFYIAVMLLLGISDATTGNSTIIFYNNLGIFLLLVCLLLHNYCHDREWNLGKYLMAVLTAVCGAVGSLEDPFRDVACYHKQKGTVRSRRSMAVLFGIGISVPFLAIVIALLYSADAVFASFLRDGVWQDVNGRTVLGVIMTFLFALFGAYCGIRYLGKGRISDEVKDYRRWEPIIAATVLALTSAVYLFFCGIQIVYLFWGKMQLPEDYTYASYAREGFFQLLFVCLINVALVLFVLAFFRESRLVRGLLLVISGCTYVMLASSAYRMVLYIRNYDLTMLRVLVLWALAVIALLLAGIMIQVIKKGFPMFRYGLVIVCLCYLGLSFSHPDYYIAEYNLYQAENKEDAVVDYYYLQHLSSDAAPVIMAAEDDWTGAYEKNILDSTETGLRKYNFSRARANRLIAENGASGNSQGKMPDYGK